MAERVFLHVGTPKSGTTFLQAVWWANRDALREQGLLLPGPSVQEHFHASCVVRGNRRLLSTIPPAGRGAWDRVLEASAAWDHDVLISHELFSPAAPERAAAALEQLRATAAEVHVLLTARDLARQLPAEWQQRTKHGRAQGFRDFLTSVQDGSASTFWQVQDVPAVLDRWGAGVAPQHQHLVVLPGPGGPRTWLWDAVCGLTGVDGTGMSAPDTSGNESLGLVQAETMRRVSRRLGEDGLDKSTERLLKGFFAEEVLRSPQPERIVLPADVWPWARERAARTVSVLAARDLDVVGDLADLVPAPDPVPGRQPEDLGEDEVAGAAVEALARFVRHEHDRRRDRASRHRDGAPARPPSGPSAAPGVLARLRSRAGRLRRRLRVRSPRGGGARPGSPR